jgi:predicted dehydrogenase
MVKVAIVGCGKIADQHVQAVARIPGSRVVAVCDRERLMAQQLAERFRIPGCFADVEEMLRAVSPDVVHVTTPPQSHYVIGRQCLEAGSHVLLEKPFTVTAAEAEALVHFAQQRGLSVTAGHNYQFTPEMIEMRRLVQDGFLGGRPVHLESHWSYDLGDVSYVGPLLGNPNHWVRRLPGQLLHNIISHGIARLAEFLDSDIVEVTARAHQSAQLRSMGGSDVMDELRVLIRNRAGNHKSYLTFLVPPLKSAREHIANFKRNASGILRWRLHQDSGMKELIERFHASISAGAPAPMSNREIVLTARLMDAIFEQIRAAATVRTRSVWPARSSRRGSPSTSSAATICRRRSCCTIRRCAS